MGLRALGAVFGQQRHLRDCAASWSWGGAALLPEPRDELLEVVPCWEHRAWGMMLCRVQHQGMQL